MAVRLSALRTGRCFTPQKHYFSASGTRYYFEKDVDKNWSHTARAMLRVTIVFTKY
jgi:hypothetical protein